MSLSVSCICSRASLAEYPPLEEMIMVFIPSSLALFLAICMVSSVFFLPGSSK